MYFCASKKNNMGYAARKKIIKELEDKRKSKIITLVTSDRPSSIAVPGINSQIAPDQVYQIIKQLKVFKEKECKQEAIDLFIYSRGGDVNTAWPLVNTIRTFAKKFNVLVPLYCHSAGTLISLGADEIVMSETGSLSPTDPTVSNAFNPKENNMPIGISVEDVTSFISLAKDEQKVGIKSEDNITKVFELLVRKVHPLALGNVQRSHTQIRLLAEKLLRLHFSGTEHDDKIKKIINELTERLYTHYHLIYRDEAIKSIGLSSVVSPDDKDNSLMWKLYLDYEEELKLKSLFDAEMYMGKEKSKSYENITVFVESSDVSYYSKTKVNLKRALVADPAHRLSVIAQTDQNNKNCAVIKAQLLNIQANITAIGAQLSTVFAANPGIGQNYQGIETLIQNLVNNTTDHIDISDLLLTFEARIEEFGWFEAN